MGRKKLPKVEEPKEIEDDEMLEEVDENVEADSDEE